MPLTITVELRHDRGRLRVHPVCALARRFAAVNGSDTFSDRDLAILRTMNVEVMERLDPALVLETVERLLRQHRLRPRGLAHVGQQLEVLFLHRHQAERAAELLAPLVIRPAAWRHGRHWRAGGEVVGLTHRLRALETRAMEVSHA